MVDLVYLGLRNRQIADRCGLAEGAVKIHIRSAYRKLGLRSRTELMIIRLGSQIDKITH